MHVTVFVLVGIQVRQLVVAVPAVWSFRGGGVLYLSEDQAFMKLFYDSSFDLAYAHLPFDDCRRLND